MMSGEDRRFIESSMFPVALVSAASAKEKLGGGRPNYWDMIFWWTRKPLASARAVIAGCLLPENIDVDEFVRALRLDEKVAHRHNPAIPNKWRQYFEGKQLLDPFAGFGSIPLEALRLGLDATAVELLPSCYVFLKAVLEYPLKYGKQLVEEVERWGQWVTERLEDDRVIRQLYDPDTAVYIGSWEIKCPHCGAWTPLIGNFWLARVKGNEGVYKQLAWMEVVKGSRGELTVSIKDLSKELHDFKGVKVEGNKVKTPNKIFTVPKANLSPRSEQATCLNPHCNGNMRYVDLDTGKHYVDPTMAPDKRRLEWYVKYALSKYHKGDLNFARLRLLVKVRVKGSDLDFTSCTEKDQNRLDLANEESEKFQQYNDPDVPLESIPLYDVRSIWVVNYGFQKWSHLFNPRQLLMIVKLVKIIREAAKLVEVEKNNQGWSGEDAVSYAEAVATYLAMGLCRFALFNSVVNTWNAGSWALIKIRGGGALSFRGIAMNWNWAEVAPISSPMYSWKECMQTEVDGLNYLISVVNKNPTRLLSIEQSDSKDVQVLFDDATVLSKLYPSEKFDLIVTDPPYYDDVPYAELSDFYYVWLKRALSNIENGVLTPRFHRTAFFKLINGKWVEMKTQWEEFALREVSLNPPRLGKNVGFEGGVDYFQELLDASFATMRSLLRNDGVLAAYYAHTDPEAWKALLKAGWESSGLSIKNVFPLATESTQSVVKRGKLSLDTSMVVIWKELSAGSIQASKLYEDMIHESEARARTLMDINIGGRDLFVGTLAGALSAATKYKEIVEMRKLETAEIVDRYVYPAALYGLVKAITRKANVEEGVKSKEAMLYLVVKSLSVGARLKTVTSNDARIFSIGTGVDLSHAMKNLRMFRAGGKEQEGEGVSLAIRKTLILLEPPSEERIKIKDFLNCRELDPENPKLGCSIDALHLLEYYAVSYGKEQFASKLEDLRKKYPAEVEEAITLARVISGSLVDDIEAKLSSRILDKIAQFKPSQQPLTEYLEGEK